MDFRKLASALDVSRLAPRLRAPELAARLEETAADLGRLARETEGEVLGLGSRLEEFSQAAGVVSQRASEVVEAIRSSQEMAKAGDIFSSASRRLGTCDAEIVSGLERLGSINQRLEDLFRLQRSLNHLTRTVRMLRVATRMETVRLKDEDSDLSMLADEIDKFSQRMDGHVAGFFAQAAEVAAETRRLAASLDRDRRDYKQHLDEAERATQAALEHIQAILAQAADLSELTARRSQDVVNDVGEIVASLQFHDITRQQLEHVQKALGEAAGHLRQPDQKGGRELASLVGRIFALQISQLHQVGAEIETSGWRIADSLNGIAESCQAQANDLAPLVGQDAQRRGLQELEGQMAALAGILGEGSRLSRRMLQSTEAAATLLDKMEGGLKAIQSINEDLNLLALNALVKVSRHGEGGRALAEVAEAVNRLSLEPREVVTQAAEEVKALLEEARELGTIHRAALSENQQQAEAVATEAEAALRGLRQLSRQVSEAVSSLAGDSESLVYEIKVVAGSVEFHSLVSERVQGAIGVLNECRGCLEAARARKGLAVGVGTGRLSGLERRYTMESERRVHREALRQKKAPPGAKAGLPPGEEGTDGGANLGDNVELF